MSRSEALPGWESFLEEATRKQELGVGLGWGVGRGSNLEDRDYAESPPMAPSLLIKRLRKQGKRERVPSSRSPKQSVVGRPGSPVQIFWTQQCRV